MKKLYLILCIALCSATLYSQGIKVVSNEEISFLNSDGYFNPVLSPKGDFMLVTSADHQGLQKYDFATKKLTPVTTGASFAFDAQITPDGSAVVYRTTEYIGRLRYASLKSLDLETGKEITLIDQTRNLEGVVVKDGAVLAVDNGILKSHRIAGKELAVTPPISSIKQGQLYLTHNNATREISPLGNDKGYLWNSVSPDETKLLFYVIEHGAAYVSAIDGSNPVSLGTMRAPKWMGNDWVVGMVDYDDGHVVTSSKIVAATADGKVRTDLTDSSVIATYPAPAADASKILYNRDGKVFLMNIEITK